MIGADDIHPGGCPIFLRPGERACGNSKKREILKLLGVGARKMEKPM